MAPSNIELIVNAVRAINPLRQVQRESKKLDGAIRDLNKRLRNNKDRFIASGNAANKTKSSFSTLAAGVGKLAVAYLGLSTAQNAFRTSIQRTESERRIAFLAKEYGEVVSLQDAASASAEKFGISQTEANRALADVYARLRPVNVGMQDIVSVFNGFTTAARLSGANTIEASNAFRQLSQALGSGVLRGDEFNSIAEQVPRILTAISQESGVAQGKLRDFAAEGGITADIVIKALKRIETDGADQLTEALDGPQQAIVEFQNALQDLKVAATQDLIPALIDSFKLLTKAIEALGGPMRAVSNGLALSYAEIKSLYRDFTVPFEDSAAADIERGVIPSSVRGALTFQGPQVGAERLFGKERLREMIDTAKQLAKLRTGRLIGDSETGNEIVDYKPIFIELLQGELAGIREAAAPANSTPINTVKTALKPPGGEENKNTKIEQERVDLSDKYIDLLRERIELSQGENEIAVAKKENELRMLEIAQSSLLPNERLRAELLSQETLSNDISQIQEKNLRLFNDQVAAAEEFGKAIAQDYLARLKEAQRPIKELYEQIGDAITTNIVNGLVAAVEGTKTLGAAAADVLRNVGSVLLQFGIQTALGGIAPQIFGKRADGGPVDANKTYLVGEEGPELFTPSRSGNILPSGSFGMPQDNSKIVQAVTAPIKLELPDFLETIEIAAKVTEVLLPDNLVSIGATVSPTNFDQSFSASTKDPELFMSPSVGSISTSGGMGETSVVVNVDASGSQVQSNESNAKALGVAIGAAVQAELVKQKRPGGLLS